MIKSEHKEYFALTDFVNQQLSKEGIEEIVFESHEAIYEDILEFPINKLLDIKDDRQFLYEAYYKILDRIIDDKSFVHYSSQLENNHVTRKKLIKILFASDERKIKQTNIIFDDGSL